LSDNRNTSEAITTAKTLSDRLEGMRAELAKVNQYSRRTRHMMVGLTLSLVLDIILTIVVSLIAVQAHSASQSAGHAFASNQALCQASNTARAQQVGLWTYLIDLSLASNPKPVTAAQKAQQAKSAALLARFERHLKVVFAPRDCAHLPGTDRG
jgi:hypothetical protein